MNISVVQEDCYLTVKDTAQYLRMCPASAYNLFNQNDFPCVKAMGKKLVKKSELDNYLKGKSNGN